MNRTDHLDMLKPETASRTGRNARQAKKAIRVRTQGDAHRRLVFLDVEGV